MGIFGTDREQDARLDALETHIRALSETVNQNQLDVINLRIAQVAIEQRVGAMEQSIGEKVDTGEIDPVIAALNEQLSAARDEYERMEAAATDSWASLHAGASDAAATLRAAVEETAARVEKKL